MSENDAISSFFSVLKAAQGIVSDIDEGRTTHQITDAQGQIRDSTEAVRRHQSDIVKILDEVLKDKDRRKSPRA